MTSLVVYSFLLLMVVYDLLSLHRIQKGTLWGSLFLIVYREVRISIGGTSAWAAVCYWARSHGIISF